MKMMRATVLLLAMAALPTMMTAQALPDGPGKDLVESQCGSCHGMEQVTAHRDTKDGWDGVVAYMVSRGMAATNEEVTIMTEYLAKNYPAAPKPAPAKTKAKANAKLVAKAKTPAKAKVKTSVVATTK
jgi:hypothetical protein